MTNPKTKSNRVIISVKGGVAELVCKPSEVAVEIYDYDNGEKCVQIYEASRQRKLFKKLTKGGK